MADGKENKLVTQIKGIPGKISKDVKSCSIATKVVALVGTVGVAAASFAAGRVSKKAPKVKPTASAKTN